MKPEELMKYLPYAPKDKNYHLLTDEQYNALIDLAVRFSKLYNNNIIDKATILAELRIVKGMAFEDTHID